MSVCIDTLGGLWEIAHFPSMWDLAFCIVRIISNFTELFRILMGTQIYFDFIDTLKFFG